MALDEMDFRSPRRRASTPATYKPAT